MDETEKAERRTKMKRKKSPEQLVEAEDTARELSRTTPKDPQQERDSLREEVQGAAARKAIAGDPAAASATDKMLDLFNRAMDQIEAMKKKIEELEGKPRIKPPPAAQLKCPSCRQATAVCGGNHEIMMVATQQDYLRHFQGVTVNGVKYLGRATVPTALVDSIKVALRDFEMLERRKQANRGTNFQDLARLGGENASPGQLPIIA